MMVCKYSPVTDILGVACIICLVVLWLICAHMNRKDREVHEKRMEEIKKDK